MNCIICGSNEIDSKDTIVSDFVMKRIAPDEKNNYTTKICFCKKCTFAYYEYRINEIEEKNLYRNYRDSEYQKCREESECWYTEKINDALNNDSQGLGEQRRVIKKILEDNNIKEIRNALDYGGNEGKTFFDELGLENKYVYDISGVDTIEGVKNISNFSDLKNQKFDFVMCNMLFEHLSDPNSLMASLKEIGNEDTIYYIEVPSENPFIKGDKFSLFKHLELVFNPRLNFFKLVKYYFKTRKEPFMPMKEHINFFTVDSMREMIQKCGFNVLDIQENKEKTVLGEQVVLSALFRI